MENFNFEDLQVHKKALVFVDKIYLINNEFPSDEKFNLTSQLRRAAISIALNITEGSASTKKDFSKFLSISSGAVRECFVCISIPQIQNFISGQAESELRKDLIEISKMISGLKNYLNKEIK